MAKKILKPYSKLSKSSQKRLGQFAKKVHLVGTTASKVKKMTDSEIRTTFQTKAKNLDTFRRLARQLTSTKERREGSIKLAIKPYIKFGFKGPKLEKIEKELTKTVGNTFSAIASDLQTKLGLSEKESYKRANMLLKIPKEHYDELTDIEVEILEDYDYRRV